MGFFIFLAIMLGTMWFMFPIIQASTNASVYGFTFSGAWNGYEVKRKSTVWYVSKPINWLAPWEHNSPQAVFWYGGNESQFEKACKLMAERRYIINVRDGFEDMSYETRMRIARLTMEGTNVYPTEELARFMDDEANGWWPGKGDAPAKRPDLKLV